MTISFSIPDWVLFFVAGWLVAATIDQASKLVRRLSEKLLKKLKEGRND